VISSSVRCIAIDQLAKVRIKYTSPCWSRILRPAIDDGQRALELTGSVGACAPVAGAGPLVAVPGAGALVALDDGVALVALDDAGAATLCVLSAVLHAVNAPATSASPAAVRRNRRGCRALSPTTVPSSIA
jgi:hypothetical protein